jgi:hypothetical protein
VLFVDDFLNAIFIIMALLQNPENTKSRISGDNIFWNRKIPPKDKLKKKNCRNSLIRDFEHSGF